MKILLQLPSSSSSNSSPARAAARQKLTSPGRAAPPAAAEGQGAGGLARPTGDGSNNSSNGSSNLGEPNAPDEHSSDSSGSSDCLCSCHQLARLQARPAGPLASICEPSARAARQPAGAEAARGGAGGGAGGEIGDGGERDGDRECETAGEHGQAHLESFCANNGRQATARQAFDNRPSSVVAPIRPIDQPGADNQIFDEPDKSHERPPIHRAHHSAAHNMDAGQSIVAARASPEQQQHKHKQPPPPQRPARAPEQPPDSQRNEPLGRPDQPEVSPPERQRVEVGATERTLNGGRPADRRPEGPKESRMFLDARMVARCALVAPTVGRQPPGWLGRLQRRLCSLVAREPAPQAADLETATHPRGHYQSPARCPQCDCRPRGYTGRPGRGRTSATHAATLVDSMSSPGQAVVAVTTKLALGTSSAGVHHEVCAPASPLTGAHQRAAGVPVTANSVRHQVSLASEGIESKRERKAAKTLAIITGVFVICWLPFFVMAITMPLLNLKPHKYVFALLLGLGYINSMLNPIIYTIFSPDFRKAFKRLLCGLDSSTPSRRRNQRGGRLLDRQQRGAAWRRLPACRWCFWRRNGSADGANKSSGKLGSKVNLEASEADEPAQGKDAAKQADAQQPISPRRATHAIRNDF